ncbi:polysaccharide biosynthesis/export family protein [Vulgatibacter incomptus]|uniref:Capsule polysaccharide export protein n=1 Tax=Vulgatibacter incomptus TaxID=1391653 RepID=A0A0K1PE45_9BACT|nr:polysaccharide biosynthesis/export family protein [Vulgatibacter incomptus]AKU91808.1 Capsule polysaccharide export protein [Vulgatibacter incomptus]
MKFRAWATFVAVVGIASILSACASGGRGSSRAVHAGEARGEPPVLVPAQTFGSGDVFVVRVVGEADLSGSYRVASDGAISFPFCGRVDVANKGATEVANDLTVCLADGYLKNPQVTVFLKEHNSKKVFVFGEVQKPGTFPFEDRMNVVQAITLAGGFTKLAARNSVLVTRSIDGREERIKVAVDDIGTGRQPNLYLSPGDIVFVGESFF